MITFTIYNHDKKIVGFESKGHAGYAERGRDIICAAVSMLVYNTIDCIKSFTDDKFEEKENEDEAYISFMLCDASPSDSAELLLKSLRKGIMSLVMNEDVECIDLFFKEV